MRNNILKLVAIFVMIGFLSCKQKENPQEEQSLEVSVKTTKIIKEDIANNILFSGKTIYLKKNQIVTPISGFVKKVNVKYGDFVHKNDLLFEIETKENKALSNDNSTHANLGIVSVLASADGFISELNANQTNVYVMEGSSLGSLVENEDLRIQVEIPFEYNSILKNEAFCKLFFSDKKVVEARISKILPLVNESSQTQLIWVKPTTYKPLPENLNVVVQFEKVKHLQANLVSKTAVMTNETQSEFWVMKIDNENIAVKIPIIKGLENDSLVEILSPDFSVKDLIITEGAYELADSAVVKIRN